MDWYMAAKDFQPLIAASVALAAAITAYLSAQAAARKQAETALTIQRHQFEDTKAKELKTHRERELAMIIRLRMKLALMDLILADRLTWIADVEGYFPKVKDGYLVSDDQMVWRYYKEVRSIVKEGEIYDSKAEDLEYLKPEHQWVYHEIYRLVSGCDKLHSDAVSLAQHNNPKMMFRDNLGYIKNLIEVSRRFIARHDPGLEDRVKQLCAELGIDYNIIRTTS